MYDFIIVLNDKKKLILAKRIKNNILINNYIVLTRIIINELYIHFFLWLNYIYNWYTTQSSKHFMKIGTIKTKIDDWRKETTKIIMNKNNKKCVKNTYWLIIWFIIIIIIIFLYSIHRCASIMMMMMMIDFEKNFGIRNWKFIQKY